MALNKIERYSGPASDLSGEVRTVRDWVNAASDVVAAFSPIFAEAATIVAKQQRKPSNTTKPWVYQLPERYRNTKDKRKFLVDNAKDYQTLSSLRHTLRNAMKHRPMPHPEDHFVYAILLASAKDLGDLLGVSPYDAKTAMGLLTQWGYALDLGVRNGGNARLGKAWLFGRMFSNGPKQSAPSWLEPPCVVPPTLSYRCECWEDKHVQTAWANPDGDGLHRDVQTAWMCQPDRAIYDH